jgi:hypothetical protein
LAGCFMVLTPLQFYCNNKQTNKNEQVPTNTTIKTNYVEKHSIKFNKNCQDLVKRSSD